ncbi:MAG: glycosyltransferase family 4 protein [Chitinophagaceae bacterium]|jgi:phosphatidyl-myo-inositol dimannoside synthase|nr:glycosyltransferase family 4 protein [Chitinophagaceae bacterium]
MPERKILFLVLTAFSSMGGIEKFNRAFIKALLKFPLIKPTFAGMYDHTSDERYVPNNLFQSYQGKQIRFVLRNIISSLQQDELILGHINLAMIGVVFKLFRPSKKLTVICHGIEVFEPVTGLKKKLLQQADTILAVSNFTKDQLVNIQHINKEKISVFPNTLDPFFELPQRFSKPDYLKQRYQLKEDEQILFTLTRLNSNEGYKGYDKVIRVLPQLLQQGLQIKYILAGKADAAETQRMNALISELKLEQQVIMPGFIADEEVTDHYVLSDVFVMPSKGEGFGIVYVEAMACGLPVIAGNKDGSTEALQFGELGNLIDPDNSNELYTAIQTVLKQPNDPQQLQQKMLSFFSFEKYTERLQQHVRA